MLCYEALLFRGCFWMPRRMVWLAFSEHSDEQDGTTLARDIMVRYNKGL